VILFVDVAHSNEFCRERFFIWAVLPLRCLARSFFVEMRESTVLALQK
jgi:hypothetical protein